MGDGRVRRVLTRVVNDDNLDLYLLGTVALVFTVLGITGISDVRTTSSVVVALLALLAFSQIRSRRLIEQIRNEGRGGAATVFSREYPAELIERRSRAHDLLLIGRALTRTVPSMRSDMVAMLAAGARIRVLVLDPTDEPLMAAADRRLTHALGPEKLRVRILSTLDDLTYLRERTGGRLEVRVSSIPPSAGFNCIDPTSPRGAVGVWHYEYHPRGETAPVFTLEPSDGVWFQHFVDEAERLWEAGTEWPLSPEAALARARRPVFSDTFGPELAAALAGTSDLFLTGTARNSFVNGNYELLKKKLQAGNQVRFLLVDPDGPAIALAADRYYAERSPDSVRDRVLHTLRLLADIKKETGGNLSVRLTSRPVPLSVIATKAALFAEYFPFQQPGTPKFVLRQGDAGHDRFLAEAETLWETATPHEL